MKRIIIVLTAFLMTFYLLAEEKSANARKITVEDAVILATDNNITLKKERNKRYYRLNC